MKFHRNVAQVTVYCNGVDDTMDAFEIGRDLKFWLSYFANINADKNTCKNSRDPFF